MKSVLISVCAMPSWFTATTIAKAHTATLATLASMSGLLKPASAVDPRTTLASAFAARPPITSTTIATTRFGSQSSSWRSTSETAGSPSASNATTSAMSRMNHFTISATKPDASVSRPMRCTKPEMPERRARLLKWIARRMCPTARAMSDATNHPTMRMMAKPMIFGIAAKKRAIAPVSDAIMASPQSDTVVATGMGNSS